MPLQATRRRNATGTKRRRTPIECHGMRSAITAFACFFLALAAAAQNFERASKEAMAKWQFPALAVAVVQDDKVVFLQAYGVKEIGKPEPVTVDTLFQIGSTTKAFTTTAMAMLAD